MNMSRICELIKACAWGAKAIIGDWFDVDRVEGQLCWVTQLVRFTTADESGREKLLVLLVCWRDARVGASSF
jgi:hypothetical protein